VKRETRLVKLSKFLALILRHQPERFGLPLDEEGWASLPEVMEILRGLPNFRWATRADVLTVVERGTADGSTEPSARDLGETSASSVETLSRDAQAEGLAAAGKRRFQVEGNRIRARYGHSLARPIRYEPCTPPPRLYHATSPDALASIRREGLRPMERQYVHLSPDPETAIHVGARHADRPVVLTVRAAEAHAAGVEFHQADEAIYLARHIPAEFLEFPARR
jgi:putative RNA 2'-phosphotransferase